MILASEYFTYDEVSSKEMGIKNVNVSSGLLSEPFSGSVSIKETKIRGRDKPYFHEVEREPITLSLNFYFEESYDEDKIRDTAKWLHSQYYKPLIFSEMPSRIFYCIPVGDITLTHNGLRQGYLELEMRCDSPYSYSPVYTETFDTSFGNFIEIDNYGDLDCYPIIQIEKTISDGNISIANMSDSGMELTLTDIILGEIITIDCENEYIETDAPNLHIYENHNDEFIRFLSSSKNRLQLTGDFIVKFIYQFTRLA